MQKENTSVIEALEQNINKRTEDAQQQKEIESELRKRIKGNEELMAF